MELLVWAGAGVSLLGVAGLLWCIWLAVKARRSGQPDAEMRAALQHVVVLNMAALAVSAIGLMMVVLGVILS